jgi:hypothetical protein
VIAGVLATRRGIYLIGWPRPVVAYLRKSYLLRVPVFRIAYGWMATVVAVRLYGVAVIAFALYVLAQA